MSLSFKMEPSSFQNFQPTDTLTLLTSLSFTGAEVHSPKVRFNASGYGYDCYQSTAPEIVQFYNGQRFDHTPTSQASEDETDSGFVTELKSTFFKKRSHDIETLEMQDKIDRILQLRLKENAAAIIRDIVQTVSIFNERETAVDIELRVDKTTYIVNCKLDLQNNRVIPLAMKYRLFVV